MKRCPQCEAEGRSVSRTTLEAQVVPARLAATTDVDAWALCLTATCEVVYFHDEDAVVLGETRALPFHKATHAERLVCFCFEHSVADVEADVAANAASTMQTSIKEKCRAGEDDCERKNPQGRCCLGNVALVVKQARAGAAATLESDDATDGRAPAAASDASKADCCAPSIAAAHDASEPPDCCAPSVAAADGPAPKASPGGPTARTGLFASGGALFAAILSSACCWLPLVAIGLGASSAGVGAFFEAWRGPLLVLTLGLLGSGFYLVYRRPRCAPGEACEVPNPRVQRLNRGLLWTSTVFVVAFALFPEYAGALTGGGGEVEAAAPTETTMHYAVEGLTCLACEGHARGAIETIPGVASVAVSYREGSAEIVWRGDPDHAAVAAAVAPFGYRAAPRP